MSELDLVIVGSPTVATTSGTRVVCPLDAIVAFRGYPQMVRAGQGPAFISKALAQWASDNGVELKPI